MEKKQRNGLFTVKYIIALIVLVNVLSAVLPPLWSSLQDLFADSASESYSNLNIVDVDVQTVPEYQGRTAEEGYQFYRFDVTVNNQGTSAERLEYTSFYLDSDEGDIYLQAYLTEEGASDVEDMSAVTDTRILPVGRNAVVTFYAEISGGTTYVEISNYNTPNGEAQYYGVSLLVGV